MDLTKVKKIYFIGIKGVALTGLAVICKKRGMEVYGSDVSEKFITDEVLSDNNIEIFEDFSKDNLAVNPDLVIIGASWGKDNIEVAEVLSKKIPYLSDSEFRGILSEEKATVAITGVHGKTTTTSLLSFIFVRAGLNPSYLIGTGKVADLPANADWHIQGKHFIVEGDEYIRSKEDKTPKFLDLNPSISVITSIEWEHVDVYKTVEELEAQFKKLVDKTKDLVVACGDWLSVKKIIKGNEDKVLTYGFSSDNNYQAINVVQTLDGTDFKLLKDGQDLGEFKISLLGEHNVLNAVAAIIVAQNQGVELASIKSLLPQFKGAQRRFDVSEKNGIIFVDDYGHHPTAIKTTLKAIRHRFQNHVIWCVFQPHMASRTKALLREFAQSFGDVDKVLFADIFASAREQDQDITSRQLEQEAKKHHKDAIYAGDLDQALGIVKENLKPGMVIVTMGAGDVYRVRDQLIS